MKDKCGVAGVWFDKDKNRDSAAIYIYYALQALQHRGQESAGIAVTGGGSVIADKGMGLVTDYFNRERLQRLAGYAGIGHVRYSTTGSSKLENCQPFTVQYKGGTIALAHNGNLVNYRELKKDLEADGRIFTSDSDTEGRACAALRSSRKPCPEYGRIPCPGKRTPPCSWRNTRCRVLRSLRRGAV